MIDIGGIFAEIELDLVRNLKGELSGGNWRTQRLRALKQFQKRNMEIFSKYPITEEAQRQIEQAYLQAGYKTQAEAKKILGKVSRTSTSFSVNDRRLKALIEQLNSDLTNAQTAAVRMMNDVYKETTAKAQVAMATNLYTMEQGIDIATQDFLSRGINCIQYANGARVNIASYAEMALRTSTRRATLIGEGAMRAELGQNLVYVSQYGACSDTCLPWQGQIYWDDVYTPGAQPDEKYPRLSEAISGGLFHPNCRHKSSTWYPGVSKIPPLMDEETVRNNAQLESQQRYNERQIRKYKRMEEGSLDPVNQAKYANKVKQWQARQRELIKENNTVLRRDYSREGTRGIGLETKLPFTDTPKANKPEYLYHATKPTSLAGIVEKGLIPNKGHAGKGVYLADSSSDALEWTAETSTGGTKVLRVNKALIKKDSLERWTAEQSGYGLSETVYSGGTIPLEAIEVKVSEDEYIPLAQYAYKYRRSFYPYLSSKTKKKVEKIVNNL